MIQRNIGRLVERSIKELQRTKKLPEFDIPKIKVEHPKEKIHGDYSTNIALLIAQRIKRSPLKIAETVNYQLLIINEKLKLFEKIETSRPGFINFFLSREYLQKEVGEILKKGKKFGEINIGKRKRVNVEFISANPTGPLHVGNGRGAFFGDCLARVLERAGYKVIREYYINDAKVNNQIKTLGQTALGKGTTYLNDYLKKKIEKIKGKIEKSKTEGEAGYLLAQEVQKDIKNFIEKKLKIKFDNWVSEEDLYKKNKIKKIFHWLKKKGLVYQKAVAWWIKTSQFGDSKDWVVIRETGEPTYLLSDITYHKDKFDRGFQKIINIWGADHQGHVLKIKAAAKMLGYKGDLDILISQVVRLKKGKISKRKGEIVSLEDLINEVGLDVARFFYLTKSLDSQMEFDLELAKVEGEKNPVYYVQYAHARICSILRKSKMQNSKIKMKMENLKLLEHQSESELIKQLIRFPEIIEETVKDYQVQRIPQYALDLATAFHKFYRDCRVISEDKKLSQARLALVLTTKIVLKNTFSLLGITALQRM